VVEGREGKNAQKRERGKGGGGIFIENQKLPKTFMKTPSAKFKERRKRNRKGDITRGPKL